MKRVLILLLFVLVAGCDNGPDTGWECPVCGWGVGQTASECPNCGVKYSKLSREYSVDEHDRKVITEHSWGPVPRK